MNRNPSLADVQARRAQIAKEITEAVKPLREEDEELAAVERVLIKRFGGDVPVSNDKAVVPLVFRLLPAAVDEKQPPSKPPLALALGETENSEDESESLIEAVKREMRGGETIEELIVMLLEECGDDWWTASEIQSHLTDVKGREVPMTTVSPTLSVMKGKGTIVRNGHNVGLAKRVQSNEAAAE